MKRKRPFRAHDEYKAVAPLLTVVRFMHRLFDAVEDDPELRSAYQPLMTLYERLFREQYGDSSLDFVLIIVELEDSDPEIAAVLRSSRVPGERPA